YAGLITRGDTYLDGSLEVVITDAASVALGDRWDLLHTRSVTGVFDTILLEMLDDPYLRLMLLASANPSDPSLEVVVRHVADVNAEMVVDAEDIDLVLGGFGETGALLAGDANTDGVVDFADLNLVSTFFGSSFRAVPSPGAAVA